MAGPGRYLALAGGVGGAKLADGLSRTLPPERLVIAVNTADDFEHLGFCISPDLDTVMYTLAGRNDTETGWGLAGETWSFMAALEDLGGETWFKLGDRDIATHVVRTRALGEGKSLSEATAMLSQAMGIGHVIVPMSDQAVRTTVHTADCALPFQDYFVRLGCAPSVTGFSFEGIEAAAPSPGLAAALADPGLSAVLIGPSNPYVSIAPIIGIPAIDEFLGCRTVPIIAVSPIVGGAALKGPAAKMMAELGAEVSAAGIAKHYGLHLDGIVIDQADAALAAKLRGTGLAVAVAPTVMRNARDRRALATAVIDFAATVAPRPR